LQTALTTLGDKNYQMLQPCSDRSSVKLRCTN